MNRLFTPGPPALRAALIAGAALSLVLDGPGRAQSSFADSTPVIVVAPMAGPDNRSWLLDGNPTLALGEGPSFSMQTLAIPNQDEGLDFPLRFVPSSGWLGPVESFLPPLVDVLGVTAPQGKKTGPDPAQVQIGSVSFNRAAESLNVRKIDVPRADDLSRQFPTAVATPNVAESVPINGWAILGITGLAVIVAVAIAHFENERRERRRHRSRQHRHRRAS